MPSIQESESIGYDDRCCWEKGEGGVKETPRLGLSICLNGLPVPETECTGEAGLSKR